MRHWLFHPIIFYPLAILLAAAAIVVSLRPQSWPHEPAAVSADRDGDWMVYERDRFNSPEAGPQAITVIRDYWGRPLRLRVAQVADQPAPYGTDPGSQILLSAEDGAALSDKPLIIEVTYNPLPVNAATQLAVSLRSSDGGPSPWITLEAPPQTATLRFTLPARSAVNAIGIRPVTQASDQAYGLEITRIRVQPRT
ncbi:MAG: hypothetical protein R3C27_14530 [Hyphomonadaceae bacterium]